MSRPNYRLKQVNSIAECSKGSILQFFRPSLSYHIPLRSLFCLFLRGRLRQVLLYFNLQLFYFTDTWQGAMSGGQESTGPCHYFDFFECHLSVRLWQIFSPIFLVVGTCGNILSIVVLSRRRLSISTTSVYLRYLAVVDTLVLIIGNLREFIYYTTNIDLRELSDASCRIHYWLSLNVTALSGWLLAILTIDRLINVKFAIWAKTSCSQKLALAICLTVTAVMFLANSHILGYLYRTEILVTSNATNTSIVLDVQCLPRSPQLLAFWLKIWPFLILILYSLVPIACLIACNIMLAKVILQRNNAEKDTRLPPHSKYYRSTTRMLFVVCSVFTAVSLPVCIFLVLESRIFVGTSARSISKRRLGWTIVSLLMYMNNAINFFLYVLSGSLFRGELRAMFLGLRASITKRMTRSVDPENGGDSMQNGAPTTSTRLVVVKPSTNGSSRGIKSRQQTASSRC